jgi:hypothetical protein
MDSARGAAMLAFRARVAACIAAAALSQTACRVHQIPPPPPPKAELPPSAQVEDTSDERRPGYARITITTDVPARVIHSGTVVRLVTTGRFGVRTVAEPLCERTPCTAWLEYGLQDLDFISLTDEGRTSRARVPVGEPNIVVNHTLGEYRSTKGRVAGMLIVLAGAVLVGIGLGLDDAPRARAIAIGAGAVVGGGLLWGLSHETLQEGATTQWSPPPQQPSNEGKSKGPVLGTSFGFRF